MMRISVSELEKNTVKYVRMANDNEIFITENGKVTAKLCAVKPDKMAAVNELFSIFPDNVNISLDEAREERLK